MMRYALLGLILLLVLPIAAQDALETSVEFIALSGDAAEANAELSALVWYGDTLLLIAENPQLYAQDSSFGSFFALEKSAILDYLDAENPSALEPTLIPIYADGLLRILRASQASFDGFEAATIQGNQIYLQIEAYTLGLLPMRSFIISGEISAAGIHLELDSLLELPVQTDYPNLSYESLTIAEENLLAIYEANGVEANPDAFAYSINLENAALEQLPMPNLPYRITDASAMDENGNFWAINYFYPPESFLGTNEDMLFNEFGRGASQTQYGGFVERLVELHYAESGIEILPQSPIQLAMSEASHGRNWEGIARLDEMGLLLVTDKFPQTLFGFVAFD